MQRQYASQTDLDAAQTRITVTQLVQALETIEAQRAAQAETLTIGEAIRDLGLDMTPEQILAAVQTQGTEGAFTISHGRVLTLARQRLRFLSKSRLRLQGGITACLALVMMLCAPPLIQATRQSDSQSQLFIQAICSGDVSLAATLLNAGVDPNTRSVSTNNPTLWAKIIDPLHGRIPALTIATARGDTRMVALLLNRGADPNIQDYLGSTQLFYLAGRHGYSSLDRENLRLLVQHGAQINFVDHRGETPRHYAQEVNNQPALVRDLTLTQQ